MSNDLSSTYGDFYDVGLRLRNDADESEGLNLEANAIPTELLPLLPYAEFWGIADDTYRIALVRVAPQHIWNEFREAVKRHKMALLDWLSGPAADIPPTPEYLAFSFMLQAFDWPREDFSK
jgi:hypothetical protein